MAAKSEVMQNQARVFRNDSWSVWILLIPGLILVSVGLLRSYSTTGSKNVAQPDINMNLCAETHTVHMSWENQRDTMPIQPNCWSETLYIPHEVTYTIQGTPGGTEVCFWLNERCAEIRTIGNGQNLDWGVYGPRDLAMRFRGGSGAVLIELTGHNNRRR